MDQALDKAAATVFFTTSKTVGNGVQLDSVITSELQIDGEPVKALLDTGSLVTLVSLDVLLQVWGRRKPPDQTPEEWKKEAGKRLQPTAVALCNHSGDRLPVMRQAVVTLSWSGYCVKATVQVLREAPANLLVGTDLLPKLRFLFVGCGQDEGDADLLNMETPLGAQGEDLVTGTVRLLQVERTLGHHAKLVRAGVKGDKECSLL